jgi:hypothetical protein
MAANDVSKTTHIYSSKSADQLISAKSNKEFIPSGIDKQINKKPEHAITHPNTAINPRKFSTI